MAPPYARPPAASSVATPEPLRSPRSVPGVDLRHPIRVAVSVAMAASQSEAGRPGRGGRRPGRGGTAGRRPGRGGRRPGRAAAGAGGGRGGRGGAGGGRFESTRRRLPVWARGPGRGRPRAGRGGGRGAAAARLRAEAAGCSARFIASIAISMGREATGPRSIDGVRGSVAACTPVRARVIDDGDGLWRGRAMAATSAPGSSA